MALSVPFTRRRLLACTAATTLYALGSCSASAGPLDGRGTKLVFILLRGGADGLAMLAPVGDPRLVSARGALGEEEGRHPVNDFFALHSGLGETAKLVKQGDGLLFHAVGLTSPTRSHFDAQNLLETGGAAPYREDTGVLNRLLGAPGEPEKGIALASSIPAALRGPTLVSSFAPENSSGSNADLYNRIAGMYGANDPRLAAIWRAAVNTRAAALDATERLAPDTSKIGSMAASFLTRSDGFDVVMIDSLGWDTHSNQQGRLTKQARELDAIIAALHARLGDTWRQTLVVVASEFGRTVATNGNGGSDHGTGGTLFALGGALPRSGVIADWPGLEPIQLLEARDLRTTTAIEAVISGLLAAHFGLDPAAAAKSLYPAFNGLTPLRL